ncbi:MAG TPA: hypothetical protein PKG54_17780 [Phycisphaerae bacterium]|jgi:hypothetical protein|nr:hypothetical protein [Phycisphaerae bacterium]HOB76365.1 hypothetical protein [Phycisphaerae bacterium]HOJ55387.1 hypothetical protein [Phycisphaerae bacterium]HOL24935.1 hypothetical protein [Phycisphaerae bacterium]HPP20037.1 hypothetical protein [Phycisphaerae bacterium]
MNKLLHRAALIAALTFAAGSLWTGCDREDARKAGEDVEKAADKAGDAVDRGLDKAGEAANRAINSEEARKAGEKAKETADKAREAAGQAAETAGDAAERAGEKVKELTSPATKPANEN